MDIAEKFKTARPKLTKRQIIALSVVAVALIAAIVAIVSVVRHNKYKAEQHMLMEEFLSDDNLKGAWKLTFNLGNYWVLPDYNGEQQHNIIFYTDSNGRNAWRTDFFENVYGAGMVQDIAAMGFYGFCLEDSLDGRLSLYRYGSIIADMNEEDFIKSDYDTLYFNYIALNGANEEITLGGSGKLERVSYAESEEDYFTNAWDVFSPVYEEIVLRLSDELNTNQMLPLDCYLYGVDGNIDVNDLHEYRPSAVAEYYMPNGLIEGYAVFNIWNYGDVTVNFSADIAQTPYKVEMQINK